MYGLAVIEVVTMSGHLSNIDEIHISQTGLWVKGFVPQKEFFYSIFLTYFFSEDKIENNANSICIHNCSRHHTSSVERFSELSIQTFSNTSL